MEADENSDVNKVYLDGDAMEIVQKLVIQLEHRKEQELVWLQDGEWLVYSSSLSGMSMRRVYQAYVFNVIIYWGEI